MSRLHVVSLGSIVSLRTEKSSADKRPDWPYVGLEHLESDSLHLFRSVPSSSSLGVNSVFREGDVLFGKLRPYLRKCAVAPFSGYCSTDILVLQPEAPFPPKFVGYVMGSERVFQYAARTSMGTRMPRTSWPQLRKLQLAVPAEHHSQERIAEILTTVDEAIEGTEKLIAKHQQIKSGLMHDLFTRGLTPDGRLRPPHTEAPHSYKDSPLGPIPKEWEGTALGDCSELVTSGSRGWARYYSETGAVFLRIGNLTRRHPNLKLEDVVRVQLPLSIEGARTRLLPGDLIMSITADLGIIGVVPIGLGEAYVNQHIALVRLKPGLAASRWLGHWLASHRAQARFRRLDDPGAKSGLNLPTIRALPVLLAPKQERDAAVRILDSSDAAIASAEGVAAKLELLKRGLMHDLLTGKVEVQVGQEEVGCEQKG